MFVLGLKGPLSPDVVRRFANDLGGALRAPFTETEAGNWVAPINDHFMDRAFGMANRHGLVVLGVRQKRAGPGGLSYRFALPDPSLQVLGTTITRQSLGEAAVSGGGSPENAVFERSQFSASASDALGRAASSAAGETLNTLHLLLALEASDVTGQWERLWLEAGDPVFLASLKVQDPEPEAEGTWDGVPLTRTCTVALDVATKISRSYDLTPVPIGALALGLVADPRSAAAQALTGQGMRHSSLIELLQEITLRVRMDDLDDLLGEIRRTSAGLSPRQSEIMPDDGGLRHLIASAATPEDAGARIPVMALCGRTWLPQAPERTQSPPDIPCPECQEIFDSMPDRLEVKTHEFNWSPLMTQTVMHVKDGKIQLPY